MFDAKFITFLKKIHTQVFAGTTDLYLLPPNSLFITEAKITAAMVDKRETELERVEFMAWLWRVQRFFLIPNSDKSENSRLNTVDKIGDFIAKFPNLPRETQQFIITNPYAFDCLIFSLFTIGEIELWDLILPYFRQFNEDQQNLIYFEWVYKLITSTEVQSSEEVARKLLAVENGQQLLAKEEKNLLAQFFIIDSLLKWYNKNPTTNPPAPLSLLMTLDSEPLRNYPALYILSLRIAAVTNRAPYVAGLISHFIGNFFSQFRIDKAKKLALFTPEQARLFKGTIMKWYVQIHEVFENVLELVGLSQLFRYNTLIEQDFITERCPELVRIAERLFAEGQYMDAYEHYDTILATHPFYTHNSEKLAAKNGIYAYVARIDAWLKTNESQAQFNAAELKIVEKLASLRDRFERDEIPQKVLSGLLKKLVERFTTSEDAEVKSNCKKYINYIKEYAFEKDRGKIQTLFHPSVAKVIKPAKKIAVVNQEVLPVAPDLSAVTPSPESSDKENPPAVAVPTPSTETKPSANEGRKKAAKNKKAAVVDLPPAVAVVVPPAQAKRPAKKKNAAKVEVLAPKAPENKAKQESGKKKLKKAAPVVVAKQNEVPKSAEVTVASKPSVSMNDILNAKPQNDPATPVNVQVATAVEKARKNGEESRNAKVIDKAFLAKAWQKAESESSLAAKDNALWPELSPGKPTVARRHRFYKTAAASTKATPILAPTANVIVDAVSESSTSCDSIVTIEPTAAIQVIKREQIPSIVMSLLDELRLQFVQAKFYLSGAAPSDILDGRKPNDYDIVAINVELMDIKEFFSHKAFKPEIRSKMHPILFCPIADGISFDFTAKSSPGTEEIGTVLEDDFSIRDYNVNGLYCELSDAAEFQVFSYADALSTRNQKVIKSVKDPKLSFREDPTRLIRLIKALITHPDYEMDADLKNAVDDIKGKWIDLFKQYTQREYANFHRLNQAWRKLFARQKFADINRVLAQMGALSELTKNSLVEAEAACTKIPTTVKTEHKFTFWIMANLLESPLYKELVNFGPMRELLLFPPADWDIMSFVVAMVRGERPQKWIIEEELTAFIEHYIEPLSSLTIKASILVAPTQAVSIFSDATSRTPTERMEVVSPKVVKYG